MCNYEKRKEEGFIVDILFLGLLFVVNSMAFSVVNEESYIDSLHSYIGQFFYNGVQVSIFKSSDFQRTYPDFPEGYKYSTDDRIEVIRNMKNFDFFILPVYTLTTEAIEGSINHPLDGRNSGEEGAGDKKLFLLTFKLEPLIFEKAAVTLNRKFSIETKEGNKVSPGLTSDSIKLPYIMEISVYERPKGTSLEGKRIITKSYPESSLSIVFEDTLDNYIKRLKYNEFYISVSLSGRSKSSDIISGESCNLIENRFKTVLEGKGEWKIKDTSASTKKTTGFGLGLSLFLGPIVPSGTVGTSDTKIKSQRDVEVYSMLTRDQIREIASEMSTEIRVAIYNEGGDGVVSDSKDSLLEKILSFLYTNALETYSYELVRRGMEFEWKIDDAIAREIHPDALRLLDERIKYSVREKGEKGMSSSPYTDEFGIYWVPSVNEKRDVPKNVVLHRFAEDKFETSKRLIMSDVKSRTQNEIIRDISVPIIRIDQGADANVTISENGDEYLYEGIKDFNIEVRPRWVSGSDDINLMYYNRYVSGGKQFTERNSAKALISAQIVKSEDGNNLSLVLEYKVLGIKNTTEIIQKLDKLKPIYDVKDYEDTTSEFYVRDSFEIVKLDEGCEIVEIKPDETSFSFEDSLKPDDERPFRENSFNSFINKVEYLIDSEGADDGKIFAKFHGLIRYKFRDKRTGVLNNFDIIKGNDGSYIVMPVSVSR